MSHNTAQYRGWSPVAETRDPRPWYRQFWPWVLIGLPLASVCAGVTTLFIAMEDPDTLVVGDYYKQGLAINRILAREDAARALALAGQLRVDLATGDVVLDLQSAQALDSTPLRLKLLHTTRAEHDAEVALKPLAPGRYAAALAQPLRLGGWTLQLMPPDGTWRITGRAYVTGQGQTGVNAKLSP